MLEFGDGLIHGSELVALWQLQQVTELIKPENNKGI